MSSNGLVFKLALELAVLQCVSSIYKPSSLHAMSCIQCQSVQSAPSWQGKACTPANTHLFLLCFLCEDLQTRICHNLRTNLQHPSN